MAVPGPTPAGNNTSENVAGADIMDIGPFTVSVREITGFSNPAVWAALDRKGLARDANGMTVTLTASGLAYDTGLGHHFRKPSDH